jgi:hypothetical protein
MVTLDLAGFNTMQYEVVVNVGATTTVDAILELGGVEEHLTVSAQSPMIEIQSAQVSNSYSEELFTELPIAREFIVVSEFTPGFADRGAYGAGGNAEGRYRRGSATNAYKLNGVDVTEPDWGNTWVNPGIDTIDEVQVVGIGASAEYGNFTGAAVNIVTKGGTNVYHGTAAYYYQNGDLRSDNYGGVPEYKKGEFEYDHDVSFTLGGPIVQEKLTFFGAYSYRSESRQPWDPDPLNTGIDTAGLPLEQTRRHRIHARIDWLANDRNTIGFMYNTDPSEDRGLGQGPGTGPEIGYGVDFGSDSWLASWQAMAGENTYIDFRYAGYQGENIQLPNVCCDVTPIYDYNTDISYETSGWMVDETNARNEFNGSVTHYADDFLDSSHTLKVGAEFESTWSIWDATYSGLGWIGMYPYGGYTYVYGYTYNAHIDAGVKRFSAYVQDDVSIGERLNLNVGLRYDNTSVNDRYDGPGGDPKTLAKFNYPAPRLGATFDVTGSGQYVAHASWGRFYEKALTYGIVGPAGVAYDAADYFITYTDVPWDPDNIDAEFWESIAFLPENLVFSYALTDYDVQDDLEGPKTDALNVGFEAELVPDWVLGVEYIHKNDNNMVTNLDRTPHDYVPVEYTDPDVGTTQTLYIRTDDRESEWYVGNNDYYFRKHDIAMVSLEKRWSRDFSFMTSLTYQNSRGNIENTAGVAWGWAVTESEATNPNYNGHPYSDGPLTYNRKWQLKVLGSYQLPWGILASAYWQQMSGRPWTPVRWFARLPFDLNDPLNRTIRVEPRGNRTRDALTRIDLRAQKDFEIGSSGRFQLFVDIFNLTNSSSPTGIYSGLWSVWPLQGGSSFGQPSGIIAPRQIRVGAKFLF